LRKWLRAIRENNGLSQKEVAGSTDITVQHYNYIENGERRPSPEIARKIAAVLGFEWTRFYEEESSHETA